MISYFDIRAARNAMRALQNKPLRRRKLDIHFSIPKVRLLFCFCFSDTPTKALLRMIVVLILQENPSDKDLNQGTLVIFNLDPSVSNEEVRQIFGAYGEVKEVSVQSIVSLHSAFDPPSLFVLTVLWFLSADKRDTKQETS